MPPETAHSNSIRMPPSFSFPCVLPVVRVVLVFMGVIRQCWRKKLCSLQSQFERDSESIFIINFIGRIIQSEV